MLPPPPAVAPVPAVVKPVQAESEPVVHGPRTAAASTDLGPLPAIPAPPDVVARATPSVTRWKITTWGAPGARVGAIAREGGEAYADGEAGARATGPGPQGRCVWGALRASPKDGRSSGRVLEA